MKKSIFNWYSLSALLCFILGVVLIFLQVPFLVYVGIALFVGSFLVLSLNFYMIYLQNKTEFASKRKSFVEVVIATRGESMVPAYYPQFEAEDRAFKRMNAKYLILSIMFLLISISMLSYFI